MEEKVSHPVLPMRMRLAAAVLGLGLLTGCVSDQTTYAVERYEKIREPKGLFPSRSEKRTRALTSVSYYFKAGKEKFLKTPHLTFQVLTYFEWLLNDVKKEPSLNKQRLARLLEARAEIREALGLDKNISVQEAIDQYYSMSKFMIAVGQFDVGGESEEAKRRKSISSIKFKLTEMLKREDIQPSRTIPPHQALMSPDEASEVGALPAKPVSPRS